MNWGSVSDWVLIGAGALIFIVGNAVIWANLKRTSGENAASIAALKKEFDEAMRQVVTLTVLGEYLDRSTENAKAIAKLKEEMVTTPFLSIVQNGCRGELMGAIAANSKDTELVKESVREIKASIDVQNGHLSNMLVVMGQLGTKIEERTRHHKQGDQ